MMLSSTVMWLHRLKCWNTIDSWLRMTRNCPGSTTHSCPLTSRRVRSSSALTMMRPADGCSRWLMQRRNVLLPDPEEPMMLITSPARALSDTPFRTSWLP
ncbi:hypothetical protein D3C75_1205140 [compost metagenome]